MPGDEVAARLREAHAARPDRYFIA